MKRHFGLCSLRRSEAAIREMSAPGGLSATRRMAARRRLGPRDRHYWREIPFPPPKGPAVPIWKWPDHIGWRRTRKRRLGRAYSRLSGCRKELFHIQSGLRDQCSQGPTGDLRVIGNRQRRGSARLRQHDMAASAPCDLPTQALEPANDFARSKQREIGHQTATSTSRLVTVNGIPSSARTAKHSRIASTMFASASGSVCPWLTQPGIEEHSAIYMPSSS